MSEQTNKVVLIQGGSTELVRTVAETLLARGATVALYHPERPGLAAELAGELSRDDRKAIDLTTAVQDAGADALPAKLAAETLGGLDAVVNLFVPRAEDTVGSLNGYTDSLSAHLWPTAEFMAASDRGGIIVNQFFLATLFADHPAAAAAGVARGALSGLTRQACVRFGKAGVRVVSLLAGLLNLPETQALASERVRAATTPLGRWIEPTDVAETVAFLTLDSGYISGQIMALDGGMTAGTSGI